RQNALANILERLTLGFTDADNMPKLAHYVECAVERGRPQRSDGQINTATIGEIEYRFLEVLILGDDDALGAIFKRQLLLARRADRTAHPRAPFNRGLRGEQDYLA